MDYKKAYALLVVTTSDAIDEICKSRIISRKMESATQILKQGLVKAEEMYLCSDE